ncbi:anti-sigma regulatory factor [Panacibacter sp. DH6]|uniref:Anti-sigma regulatory factor n=1 Tax=Panacibacter microcysteis TaxID=2793269 RepID=A0A931E4T1_9BACT|nr:anti-sigma regulatory factor [Panacibacter microcysteis]MBG9377058.1 anti-sigma regulatory factor [Panacibacter microcysteis]
MLTPKVTIVTLNKDTISVYKENEVILLRNRVKEYAVKIKMGIVNQTKLLTAVSELVRNMLKYANGGTAVIEVISGGMKTGIRVTFTDNGPGIKDIGLAMKDGYSTGKSLGLGLPGTKRLVNDFSITSEVGKGTSVTILKWANG